MSDHFIVVDLEGCARCQGPGHKRLTFAPLTHPVDDPELALTHWAPCPTNGEPILLGVEPEVEELAVELLASKETA